MSVLQVTLKREPTQEQIDVLNTYLTQQLNWGDLAILKQEYGLLLKRQLFIGKTFFPDAKLIEIALALLPDILKIGQLNKQEKEIITVLSLYLAATLPKPSIEDIENVRCYASDVSMWQRIAILLRSNWITPSDPQNMAKDSSDKEAKKVHTNKKTSWTKNAQKASGPDHLLDEPVNLIGLVKESGVIERRTYYTILQKLKNQIDRVQFKTIRRTNV